MRSRLEFVVLVWSPHKKETCMEIGVTAKDGKKDSTRAKRDNIWEETESNTGAERIEGDLIQVYKQINGMDVVDNELLLEYHQ